MDCGQIGVDNKNGGAGFDIMDQAGCRVNFERGANDHKDVGFFNQRQRLPDGRDRFAKPDNVRAELAPFFAQVAQFQFPVIERVN